MLHEEWHLHEVLKVFIFVETESRMVITRDCREGEN